MEICSFGSNIRSFGWHIILSCSLPSLLSFRLSPNTFVRTLSHSQFWTCVCVHDTHQRHSNSCIYAFRLHGRGIFAKGKVRVKICFVCLKGWFSSPCQMYLYSFWRLAFFLKYHLIYIKKRISFSNNSVKIFIMKLLWVSYQKYEIISKCKAN